MGSASIKNGINSDVGIMRFVISVVEMYFSSLVDVFIGLTGGTPDAPIDDTRRQNKDLD